MKTRKVFSKVLISLLFLLMISFISCEKKDDCKICKNDWGDTVEACSGAEELLACTLGYCECY
jgi:hypothetical protein